VVSPDTEGVATSRLLYIKYNKVFVAKRELVSKLIVTAIKRPRACPNYVRATIDMEVEKSIV
jgi:hypothetical protein